MTRTRSIAAACLASLSLAAVWSADAPAAGIPNGCTTSGVNTQFANDPASNDVFHIHRAGDELQIGVRISNSAAGACTVDGATVTVQTPGADGLPGPKTTIASNATYPGGMAATDIPAKAPYTIAFNPAVFRGPVTIEVSGTWHYPGGDLVQTQSASTNVVVSKPHTTLTVTPSTTGGLAPLGVTYTYTLANDSPADPAALGTTPSLNPPSNAVNPDGSALADDLCGPVAYTTGDTTVSNPSQLNPGETWTFSCVHLFGDFGAFANHVSVAGISTRDGRAWPVTTAQALVTATAPDLTITKTHTGAFTRGDSGRAFTLTVTNSGNVATTSGEVTVVDTLPAGLSATAIAGTGWTCVLGTLTCKRTGVLGAGTSYPPITVTTDVAANAPATVTNTATVSGGAGELNTANDGASDPVTVNPVPVAPTAGAPSGTPTATPASNRFTITRVRATRRGTAVFTVTAPGAGVFTLAAGATVPGGAAATVRVGTAKATAKGAGPVTLTLRPSAAAARILGRRHRLKTRVAITFTPTGGTAAVQRRTVTLVRRAR